LELVKAGIYWPGLHNFVFEFYSTCNDCPGNKAAWHRPYGLLKQLLIPERSWESNSVDFIGELPTSIMSGLQKCDLIELIANNQEPCHESPST
jgi:hypothetical protein